MKQLFAVILTVFILAGVPGAGIAQPFSEGTDPALEKLLRARNQVLENIQVVEQGRQDALQRGLDTAFKSWDQALKNEWAQYQDLNSQIEQRQASASSLNLMPALSQPSDLAGFWMDQKGWEYRIDVEGQTVALVAPGVEYISKGKIVTLPGLNSLEGAFDPKRVVLKGRILDPKLHNPDIPAEVVQELIRDPNYYKEYHLEPLPNGKLKLTLFTNRVNHQFDMLRHYILKNDSHAIILQQKAPSGQFIISSLDINRTRKDAEIRELQRQMHELDGQMQALVRAMRRNANEFATADQEADALGKERQLLIRKIKDLQFQIKQADRPEKKPLTTLSDNRNLLLAEIRNTEERILATASTQERAKLFSQLDALNTQLAQVEAVDGPQSADQSANSTNSILQQLDVLELEDLKLQQREIRAIERMNLIASRIDEQKSEVDVLDAQKLKLAYAVKHNELDNPVRRIEISADEKLVYRAEWQGSIEEVKALKKTIAELEALTLRLEKEKQNAWNAFYEQFAEVTRAYEEMHGSYVSQGNGILATLQYIALSDGRIMQAAKGQAILEAASHSYDLVEGWSKGGPAGALAVGVYKLAMELPGSVIDQGVDYAAPIGQPQSGFDENSLFEHPELKEPITTAGVAKTALRRSVNAGIGPYGKTYINQKIGVPLAELIARADQSRLQSMLDDIQSYVRRSSQRADQAAKAQNYIKNLTKADNPTGKGVLKGLLKDSVKTAGGATIQMWENNGWQRLWVAQGTQIGLYHLYRDNAELYWEAKDKLTEMQEGFQKRQFDAGFEILHSAPFDHRANLNIFVSQEFNPLNPDETAVFIENVQATSTSTEHYRLKASSLPVQRQNPAPARLMIQSQAVSQNNTHTK